LIFFSTTLKKSVPYPVDRIQQYHIRIRDNFWVKDPRTGKESKAWWMFNNLGINECRVLYRIYYVNNQLCYLSASKIKNKEGKLKWHSELKNERIQYRRYASDKFGPH